MNVEFCKKKNFHKVFSCKALIELAVHKEESPRLTAVLTKINTPEIVSVENMAHKICNDN